MVVVKQDRIKDTKYFDTLYKCNWPGCGHQFRKIVGRTGGEPTGFTGKTKVVSSQVQCPRCGNGLKTWPKEDYN